MSQEIELPLGWRVSLLHEVAEILDPLREPINAEERATRPGSVPYYGATGQVGFLSDTRLRSVKATTVLLIRKRAEQPRGS